MLSTKPPKKNFEDLFMNLALSKLSLFLSNGPAARWPVGPGTDHARRPGESVSAAGAVSPKSGDAAPPTGRQMSSLRTLPDLFCVFKPMFH